MGSKAVMFEAVKEFVKDIGVGGSIDSSSVAHAMKVRGFNPSRVCVYLTRLGFTSVRGGPASRWYRKFVPLDTEIQTDENGKVPSVLERLEVQVANGERNAPVQAASEERPAPAVRLPEAETAVTEEEPRGGYTIEQAKFEMAASESPKPRCYPFESVLITKTLTGQFGTYTIRSDGTFTMEHLLPGTLNGSYVFAELVDELCAVKAALDEMERNNMEV